LLRKEIRDILADARGQGWVMEPEAKRLLALARIKVPRFAWVRGRDEAIRASREIGYPVVAKVVSPKAVHKTEVKGVALGLDNDDAVADTFERFSSFADFEGVLVEEMLSGTELIIGAKVDYQFGPVILLGIGGTGVEIYGDRSLRMAPLTRRDVRSMVEGLRAHELIQGYRGSKPVDQEALRNMLLAFSDLVMDMGGLTESVDLNPVMCSEKGCVVADARIILKREE
jgi:acyl-CoA synthetase (NDP forming)